MHRIQYHEYGGPELMRLEEFEPATPGKGEVLVRVRAAAANPMDWKVRNGTTKLMTGRRFPRGMGHDFAGTVAGVGEGVSRFKPGDDVLGAMSMKVSGAFADVVVADENFVVMKPPELSFAQAAALPTVGVTALQCLDKGELQSGQSAFVVGCLGGVGRAAAQLAMRRGASVAGSCRATAASAARALGVDPVVAFDFDPEELKGRFDVVIDTVGTRSIKTIRTLLKPGGRIVDINPSPAKMTRAVVSRDFRPLIAKYTRESLEAAAAAAARGTLDLPVARTVPLTQAIESLTELERTRTPKGGKLVITPT